MVDRLRRGSSTESRSRGPIHLARNGGILAGKGLRANVDTRDRRKVGLTVSPFSLPITSQVLPEPRGFVRGVEEALQITIGFVLQRRPRLGSFRQAVTDYRGFVSSAPWVRSGNRRGVTDYHWVRFAATLEIGFVSSRRYRLQWLRFGESGEALRKWRQLARHWDSFCSRGTPEIGSVSSPGFGSFGEIHEALQLAIGFVLQLRAHGLGSVSSRRIYRLPLTRSGTVPVGMPSSTPLRRSLLLDPLVSGIRFVRGFHQALHFAVADIWEFFPRVAESNNYRSRFFE